MVKNMELKEKENEIKEKNFLTVDELARTYEVADVTMKAWICCQKDSGLSTLDLLSVDFKSVKEQLDKKIVPIHIVVNRKMTDLVTNTFFGSDAIDTLEKYVLKQNSERLFGIRQKIVIHRLRKLGLTPFILRTFFYRKMVKAHVRNTLIEHWMGHSKIDSSVEEMKKIYTQAYSHITICKNPLIFLYG